MKRSLAIFLIFCLLGLGSQAVLPPLGMAGYGLCAQVAKVAPGFKALESPDHSMISNGSSRVVCSHRLAADIPSRSTLGQVDTHSPDLYLLLGSFRS